MYGRAAVAGGWQVRVVRAVLVLMAVLVSARADAANWYVTPTGAGDNSGTSWATACNGATLVCRTAAGGGSVARGDTIYFEDGDYLSDGVLTLSKAVSGATRITVKKCTAADHGTETGYVAANCDGVAILAGLSFLTGYWTWDGQVGAGDGSTTAYGFKIDYQTCTGANSNDTKTAVYAQDLQEMIIQYTEIEHCGEDQRFDGTTEVDGSCAACGFSSDALRMCNATVPAGDPGHQLRYLYIHDLTRNGITLCGTNNTLMEYIYMARLHSADPVVHGQCIQFSQPPMSNNTVRYSTFIDIAGTACMSLLGSSTTATYANHYFYGNLFYTTASIAGGVGGSRYYYSPGAMYGRESDSGTNTYDGFYVYNNTFYNVINPETAMNGEIQTNIHTKNNIYVNSDFGGSGHVNVDESTHNFYYNNVGAGTPVGETGQQDGSGSPFVDAATYDFTLIAATDAGATLASPYDTDPLGVTRSVDGVFDRGAFEYDSGNPPPAPGGPPVRLRIRPGDDAEQGIAFRDQFSGLRIRESFGGLGHAIKRVLPVQCRVRDLADVDRVAAFRCVVGRAKFHHGWGPTFQRGDHPLAITTTTTSSMNAMAPNTTKLKVRSGTAMRRLYSMGSASYGKSPIDATPAVIW
jgi:hypothetical protein